jgi:hypothetical protein
MILVSDHPEAPRRFRNSKNVDSTALNFSLDGLSRTQ